jgi:hypothetical protein
MLQITRQYARNITQQACAELVALSARERKIADKHLQVTRVTYETFKSPDFLKAEQRHADVISGYRAGEEKKLSAYKQRDDEKKPTSVEQLNELMCNRVSRDPDIIKQVEVEMQMLSLEGDDASTNNGGERKRKKPNSEHTVTRPASPGPSTSRTDQTQQRSRERSRERNQDRGGYRRGPHQGNRGRQHTESRGRGRGYTPYHDNTSRGRGRGYPPNHDNNQKYKARQSGPSQYKGGAYRGCGFYQNTRGGNKGRGREYHDDDYYQPRQQRDYQHKAKLQGSDRAFLEKLCNKFL